MANVIWGIDITGSAVKGVKMELGKNGPAIIDAHGIDIPDTGDDEEARDEAVQQTLSTFFEAKGVTKKEGICISIPGHTTFSRPVTLPPVDPKKLAEIVEYEAQQYIPFAISDVVWDYHVLNPAGLEEGEDPQVMLFAVRREDIFPYLSIMHTHNLDLRVLQTNPVATYNFLKHDINPESAIVALDIGAEYTSLIIIYQDNFWVRNLPIAGNEITKRLQKKLKLSWEDAEDLKKKMSTSKQAQKIFQVIEPTLKELVGEVHRSMGYFKSQAGGVKFTSLILLGSGSNVFGLPRYLENQLQLKIQRVKSFENIEMGARAKKVLNSQRLPGFTTAIGLALQGLGLESSSVNFLPKELQAIRDAAKQKPWYVGGAALAAAGVLVMGIKAGQEVGQLKLQVDPLQDKITALKNTQQNYQAEKNSFPLERSLDRLVSMIPSSNDNPLQEFSKISELFTNNFDYEKDGSALKVEKQNLTTRALPLEKDKIYFYSIEYGKFSMTPEGRAGRGQEKNDLSIVRVMLQGCIPHDPAEKGSDKDLAWCEKNILEPMKQKYGTRNDVIFQLDRKAVDMQVIFPYRWDPEDSGKQEGSTTDRFQYYFFQLEIKFPDYSNLHEEYVKQVEEKLKKLVATSGMPAGDEQLKEARKQSLQAILKGFKSDNDFSALQPLQIIEGLSSKLSDLETSELHSLFGIAPTEAPEEG